MNDVDLRYCVFLRLDFKNVVLIKPLYIRCNAADPAILSRSREGKENLRFA